MEIRVLTWNVFHAHDGHPDARPDWRSTLLGTAVDSGTHLHQNRTLVAAVGHLVARAAPMVALLQEVPPWAAEQIAAGAGMDASARAEPPRGERHGGYRTAFQHLFPFHFVRIAQMLGKVAAFL